MERSVRIDETGDPAEPSGDTPALRLFALLELIAAKDQLFTLQGLVEETGLPKPTLHRMLQQLEGAGLLTARERRPATTAPACAAAPPGRKPAAQRQLTTARATRCCAIWWRRSARAATSPRCRAAR